MVVTTGPDETQGQKDHDRKPLCIEPKREWSTRFSLLPSSILNHLHSFSLVIRIDDTRYLSLSKCTHRFLPSNLLSFYSG